MEPSEEEKARLARFKPGGRLTTVSESGEEETGEGGTKPRGAVRLPSLTTVSSGIGTPVEYSVPRLNVPLPRIIGAAGGGSDPSSLIGSGLRTPVVVSRLPGLPLLQMESSTIAPPPHPSGRGRAPFLEEIGGRLGREALIDPTTGEMSGMPRITGIQAGEGFREAFARGRPTATATLARGRSPPRPPPVPPREEEEAFVGGGGGARRAPPTREEMEEQMNARRARELAEARARQERMAEEVRAAARRRVAAVGTLETDGGGLRLAEVPPRIPAARPFGGGRPRPRTPPPDPAEARAQLRLLREGAAARARTAGGEAPRLRATLETGGVRTERGGVDSIPTVISVRGTRGGAGGRVGRGGRGGGGGGGGAPPSGAKSKATAAASGKGGMKTFNVGGSICVPKRSKKGNKISCVVYENEFGCQKV